MDTIEVIEEMATGIIGGIGEEGIELGTGSN